MVCDEQGALVLFGHSAKRHFAEMCLANDFEGVYYMDNHLSGASRAVYRQVFRRLAQLGCALSCLTKRNLY